jgi:hypothetical protein
VPGPERDENGGRRGGCTWRDWQDDGFRGPPPWRRGYQPLHLVASICVFALLLAVLLWGGSRIG